MNRRIALVAGLPIAAGILVYFFNAIVVSGASGGDSFEDSLASTLPIGSLVGIDENRPITYAALNLDPKITDDNIIPPINYTARKYKDVGLQYPPVAVANKCLFYFSHVRNETAWAYGTYVADWFAERGERYEEGIAFVYNFDWKPYNLTKGWKSGLSQALVAECFLKAYGHTGDEKYLALAKQSLTYLKVHVSEGGVMIDEGDSKWWYEEYPMKGGSYVLSSHQFVLLGLSKYLNVADEPEIRQLFDNGLKALKADAMLYDNGTNDSFYDRLGGPAKQYHNTHIINFQRLYDITKEPEWLEIKRAFES